MLRIGTAGWSIPLSQSAHFPGDGTHLERYARVLPCAEINSSFHRPHRRSTYERWAASVPESFRFSCKVPKTITHERKLVDVQALLEVFLEQSAGLGEKRAVLLVQLPPKFAFDARVIEAFFMQLREQYGGLAVCEPRHVSWFTPEAQAMLEIYRIARVAADPALCEAAAVPGGWPGLVYVRWHGSPRRYYSSYEDAMLETLATQLAGSEAPAWCIFDNTASGAAAADALRLAEMARLGES